MDGSIPGRVPGAVVCDAAAAMGIRRVEILGVITRADGTVEDLGIMAASDFEQIDAATIRERQLIIRQRARAREVGNAA